MAATLPTVPTSVGKSGSGAKAFIKDNKLENFSLTPHQQAELFNRSYATESGETKRICTKSDVEAKYGECDWDKLNNSIKEVLIDLKFRGDYTPNARKLLQKFVAQNDLAGFAAVIIDQSNWVHVPADRFDRRKKFMQAALKKETGVGSKKPMGPPKPAPNSKPLGTPDWLRNYA